MFITSVLPNISLRILDKEHENEIFGLYLLKEGILYNCYLAKETEIFINGNYTILEQGLRYRIIILEINENNQNIYKSIFYDIFNDKIIKIIKNKSFINYRINKEEEIYCFIGSTIFIENDKGLKYKTLINMTNAILSKKYIFIFKQEILHVIFRDTGNILATYKIPELSILPWQLYINHKYFYFYEGNGILNANIDKRTSNILYYVDINKDIRPLYKAFYEVMSPILCDDIFSVIGSFLLFY